MSAVTATKNPSDRFEFGENWQRFLSVLGPERIAEAERSLASTLGSDALTGLAVLDAGSGSGLFSLAAMRLGADRVRSFDFDPASVACTAELKRRYLPGAGKWEVERGDLLDGDYLDGLGGFDLVYSWGVAHHTGEMWTALGNLDRLVTPGGALVVSIYNDQGPRSRGWRLVKRTYNLLPDALKPPFAVAIMGPREVALALIDTARGEPMAYVRRWTEYKRSRGMSRWHDIIDWVGGFPFEVATPEEVFAFYKRRGYTLERLRTCGGKLGCNEFVFRKAA